MDNLRLFLYAALGLIVLLIVQAWQKEHPSTAPVASAPSVTQPAPKEPAAVPEAPQESAAPAQSDAPKPGAAIAQGKRIEVVTDLMRVEIDTEGGDLRRLYLLKHPVSVDTPDVPFRLMSDQGELLFSQSGLIGRDADFPTHRTRYQVARERFSLGDEQELRVPLTYQGRDGVHYTKTYVFRRNSYAIDIEFTVDNRSKNEWKGYLYGQFQRSYVDTSGGLTRVATYTGAAIYTPEDKYEKVSFDDMTAKRLKREVTGGWVAMLQHYFVTAYLPRITQQIELYSDVVETGRFVVGFKQLTPTTVAAGQRDTLRTRLYAGPKEQSRLGLLTCAEADLAQSPCDKEPQYAPGMKLTVDYGVLTFISAPLFWLLDWIHKVVHNWGWAIVILTFLVKLAFYPLSAMSYRSMAQMRKVAPKMEAIKKQHANDRQALNQAMMELYRTEKINPFGGCLPILIQIPVFLALYWVLLESVEMRQASWLWVKDLSSKDPYFILPIVMGGSMYLQQLLSPQPPDPMQRKMFLFMPLIFTAMFIFFPAGLVLYWTVNNLLSILQQWRINQVVEGGRKAKAK